MMISSIDFDWPHHVVFRPVLSCPGVPPCPWPCIPLLPRVVGALGAAAMYAEAGAVLLARSRVHPALRSTSAKLCVLRRYLDGVAAEAGSELAGVQATVGEAFRS